VPNIRPDVRNERRFSSSYTSDRECFGPPDFFAFAENDRSVRFFGGLMIRRSFPAAIRVAMWPMSRQDGRGGRLEVAAWRPYLEHEYRAVR
jgi:hypothetical protein